MGTIRRIYEDHQESARYVIFGGMTVVVSWLSYAIFVWLGIDLNISNILSWISGVLFAFVVNKWFVFICRSTDVKTVTKELGSFFSARIFTGVIAIVLFPIFLSLGMDQVIFGTEGFLAKIVTSLIEIALNWILSKYLVFTKKTNIDAV